MSDKAKKILFAIFFVTFSVGMGFVVYRMLFGTPDAGTPTAEPPAPTFGGSLPTANTGTAPVAGGDTGGTPFFPETVPGGTGAVGTLPTAAAQTTLAYAGIAQAGSPDRANNGARFYNPEDGTFYRTNADGSVTTLSSKQFFNVSQVSWGNTSDQAILSFQDGRKVHYDFQTQSQVTLPSFWSDFSFSGDDQKVVGKSLGLDENNRFLIVANPNGSEAKAVEALGRNADRVFPAWVGNGKIVAYTKTGEAQSGGGQQIYLVGQNQENIKSLNVPGQGFIPAFSPSGRTVVYSVWHERSLNKPELWVSSADVSTVGAGRRSLKLNTWADKCAWATETTLYCAVPQGLPENAGLQRESFATLPDDLYRLDLDAGTAVKIDYAPGQEVPMKGIVPAADGSSVFYTDASTGKLYKHLLK